MKKLLILLAVGLFYVSPPIKSASASEGVCGYYAFAGAFHSYRSAKRRANRVGGQVFNLDDSDSPNAGTGLWVVGAGPGPRRWANQRKRRFRRNGVRDAYIASRCMY
ncbi:MAG: hypothetical protein V3V02_03665 [Rhizobiaceae bacterium]